jgi:hypothetical protein
MNKLDAELQEIQDGLANSTRQYISSKQLTYTELAKAYLWWRKAIRRKGYLEGVYAANKIKGKKTNSVNWHMLVKLIFRMQQTTQAAHIGNFAHALKAIDTEYISRQFVYERRENPVAELVTFINDSGGIGKLRGKQQENLDDDGDDDIDAGIVKAAKKAAKRKDDRLETEAQVLEQKKTAALRVKTGKQVDFGEVATNDDELVLVLAKRNDYSGKLTVIGTTAEENAVNRALLEIGDVDYSNLSPVLRTVVEALKPNIIPKRLQQQNVRAKFYEKTKIKTRYTNKKGATEDVVLSEKTRLVVRKDGTILVSKSPSEASLTTIAKPKLKFGNKTDVFLRGSDRYWLETDLMNLSQIILYSAEPKQKLAKASDKVNADYQITLSNSRNQAKRNIYFYDVDKLDGELGYQPNVVAAEYIKYGWSITASASYVRRLNAHHIEKWLYGMNKGVKLQHNLHFQLHCTSKHLEIQSDWQNEKYQQQGKEFQTVFGKDAKVKVHNKDTKITVSPLDLVQVFATICEAQLEGNVVIEGNKNLMHIQYSTAIADYDLYIPACDLKGKRDATYFTPAYSLIGLLDDWLEANG